MGDDSDRTEIDSGQSEAEAKRGKTDRKASDASRRRITGLPAPALSQPENLVDMMATVTSIIGQKRSQ